MRPITDAIYSKLTAAQKAELGLVLLVPPAAPAAPAASADSKPVRLGPPVDDEGELHADIARDCLTRGWLAFHGSMAHKAMRTPGEPDFVILRQDGRVLLVECKSKTGKPSTDQLGVAAWAKKLGHTVHLVRNMAEFQAAIIL